VTKAKHQEVKHQETKTGGNKADVNPESRSKIDEDAFVHWMNAQEQTNSISIAAEMTGLIDDYAQRTAFDRAPLMTDPECYDILNRIGVQYLNQTRQVSKVSSAYSLLQKVPSKDEWDKIGESIGKTKASWGWLESTFYRKVRVLSAKRVLKRLLPNKSLNDNVISGYLYCLQATLAFRSHPDYCKGFNPNLVLVMPNILFDIRNDQEMMRWTIESLGMQKAILDCKKSFNDQLVFATDHPVNEVLRGKPKLSNIGTAVGWLGTEGHAMAFSVHVTANKVWVWVYGSRPELTFHLAMVS
jgi:hypothetical protein